VLIILQIIIQKFYIFAISIFIIKAIIQVLVLNKINKNLKEKNLIWMAPILDFLNSIFLFSFFIISIFNKETKWK
jgi:hypothetical protein